jgi:hypothetical protein
VERPPAVGGWRPTRFITSKVALEHEIPCALEFVPQRDPVFAGQRYRWLEKSPRLVHGTASDGREVEASALVEPQSVDVVIRRHDPAAAAACRGRDVHDSL